MGDGIAALDYNGIAGTDRAVHKRAVRSGQEAEEGNFLFQLLYNGQAEGSTSGQRGGRASGGSGGR